MRRDWQNTETGVALILEASEAIDKARDALTSASLWFSENDATHPAGKHVDAIRDVLYADRRPEVREGGGAQFYNLDRYIGLLWGNGEQIGEAMDEPREVAPGDEIEAGPTDFVKFTIHPKGWRVLDDQLGTAQAYHAQEGVESGCIRDYLGTLIQYVGDEADDLDEPIEQERRTTPAMLWNAKGDDGYAARAADGGQWLILPVEEGGHGLFHNGEPMSATGLSPAQCMEIASGLERKFAVAEGDRVLAPDQVADPSDWSNSQKPAGGSENAGAGGIPDGWSKAIAVDDINPLCLKVYDPDEVVEVRAVRNLGGTIIVANPPGMPERKLAEVPDGWERVENPGSNEFAAPWFDNGRLAVDGEVRMFPGGPVRKLAREPHVDAPAHEAVDTAEESGGQDEAGGGEQGGIVEDLVDALKDLERTTRPGVICSGGDRLKARLKARKAIDRANEPGVVQIARAAGAME